MRTPSSPSGSRSRPPPAPPGPRESPTGPKSGRAAHGSPGEPATTSAPGAETDAEPESVAKTAVREIRTRNDIVLIRQAVREWAREAGFGLVDRTKIITAAGEPARNAVTHGGGGTVTLELVNRDGRRGLRPTFADEGPGIPDVELALTDGDTSGGGMGLGPGGSRRLVNGFEVSSRPGEGARVTVTRWT